MDSEVILKSEKCQNSLHQWDLRDASGSKKEEEKKGKGEKDRKRYLKKKKRTRKVKGRGGRKVDRVRRKTVRREWGRKVGMGK